MVATGISILATFASFADIASDSNASYEVENEVMDDETSDNQDNESFETSDKISGDVEIGDFDLPEEPEITVEDNTETVIIEEKDEVVDIFTETDTDIEVEVDVEDIMTEPSVSVVISEQETVPEADDNTVIVYDDVEIQEEEFSFETSDKIVGEVEIGDFDLPEEGSEEPEVVPPAPEKPEQPEEIPSEPEEPVEPETPQEPEEPETPQEPEEPEEPVKPATPSDAEPVEPEGPRGHYSGNDDDDDDITVIRVSEPEPTVFDEPGPTPAPEPLPDPADPVDPVDPIYPDLPKTGDNTNILLGVFLISGAMLIALLKKDKSETRKETCAASDDITINPAEYVRIRKMVITSVDPIYCTSMEGTRQIALCRRLDYLSRKVQGKPNVFIWQLCSVIRGIIPIPLGILKKRKIE